MGSGASVQNNASNVTSSKTGGLLKSGKDAMKILIVGEPKCGKTAVFLRYVRNQFYSAYWPTMEPQIETVVKKVNVPSAEIVSIQLWDVPGDEDVDLFYQYCKDVDAAIVVADLNQPDKIEKALEWKQRVFDNLAFSNLSSSTTDTSEDIENGEEREMNNDSKSDLEERKKQVAFLLVGSKLDLIKANEHIEGSGDSVDEPKRQEKLVEEVQVKEEETINARSKIDTGLKRKKGSKATKTKKSEQLGNQSNSETSKADKGETSNAHPVKEEGNPTLTTADLSSSEPPVIEALRLLGEENGFITTVLVSASYGDHSVHTAVQYVVRHIVQQRIAKVRSAEKSTSVEKARESDKLLEHCGLEEFDELFDKCTLPLRWTREYSACCELTLSRLRASCVNAEITDNFASLQDCVHALKEALDITITDDEPFVAMSLKVEPNDDDSIEKRLSEAMECFNKEYAAVRKSVLSDGPTVDLTLRKLDCRISARTDTAWEQLATERGIDQRHVLSVIEKNRARLLDASQLLEKILEECLNEITQIRTAMMW